MTNPIAERARELEKTLYVRAGGYADIPNTFEWQAAKIVGELLAEIDRLSAAAVPEGWQLVPKEPTEAMNARARAALRGWVAPMEHPDDAYRAMLAAARPHQPQRRGGSRLRQLRGMGHGLLDGFLIPIRKCGDFICCTGRKNIVFGRRGRGGSNPPTGCLSRPPPRPEPEGER